MAGADHSDQRVIESKQDLIAFIAQGEKPRENWRIGTEHEKFGFHLKDHTPLPYEGPSGIRALLEELQKRYGWEPVYEQDVIIGLKQPGLELGGSISLEPGGQFELSGAPVKTIHDTCKEVHDHLMQVRLAGDDLGIGMLGLGFSPKWTRSETPKMPKGRYKIMTDYMPKKGSLGLDMMYRSCTVQVNLDFSSESDMVKKFRVSLALQPIVTALFANSPFTEGKPNGFLSFRSEIWRNTDPDRTGMIPFVFEEGMSYERYVDYALSVPMYFVYRNGKYIDASGKSFKDFLAGKLDVLPGQRPTLSDWTDHLTTLFPEVRLKRYLEMRGADGGPWRRLCGLPALWVGVLYEADALEAAWDLVKDWDTHERQTMRDQVPVTALKTPFRSYKVQDIAKEMIQISLEGLKRRAAQDGLGSDERLYISELEQIAHEGWTSAERLLDSYHNVWGQNIDQIFIENAY